MKPTAADEAGIPLETPVISLFWTGGWDSTFRLLYLLLVEERRVRPYYVIDTGRASMIFELKARERIRDELFRRYPRTKGLLLPSILVLKTDLQPNEEISRQYERLTAAVHIGTQFEWLARFAHEYGLPDVEVCSDKTPPGLSPWVTLIIPELVGEGHNCRIRDHGGNGEFDLFRRFRFSTIHLTKRDMKQLAEQHGFDDILRNAWFCHKPTRQGLPCGECIPCKQAKPSGWEHKFAKRSLVSRVRWKINSIVQGFQQSAAGRSLN